jgi:hypothetical protein
MENKKLINEEVSRILEMMGLTTNLLTESIVDEFVQIGIKQLEKQSSKLLNNLTDEYGISKTILKQSDADEFLNLATKAERKAEIFGDWVSKMGDEGLEKLADSLFSSLKYQTITKKLTGELTNTIATGKITDPYIIDETIDDLVDANVKVLDPKVSELGKKLRDKLKLELEKSVYNKSDNFIDDFDDADFEELYNGITDDGVIPKSVDDILSNVEKEMQKLLRKFEIDFDIKLPDKTKLAKAVVDGMKSGKNIKNLDNIIKSWDKLGIERQQVYITQAIDSLKKIDENLGNSLGKKIDKYGNAIEKSDPKRSIKIWKNVLFYGAVASTFYQLVKHAKQSKEKGVSNVNWYNFAYDIGVKGLVWPIGYSVMALQYTTGYNNTLEGAEKFINQNKLGKGSTVETTDVDGYYRYLGNDGNAQKLTYDSENYTFK